VNSEFKAEVADFPVAPPLKSCSAELVLSVAQPKWLIPLLATLGLITYIPEIVLSPPTLI